MIEIGKTKEKSDSYLAEDITFDSGYLLRVRRRTVFKVDRFCFWYDVYYDEVLVLSSETSLKGALEIGSMIDLWNSGEKNMRSASVIFNQRIDSFNRRMSRQGRIHKKENCP